MDKNVSIIISAILLFLLICPSSIGYAAKKNSGSEERSVIVKPLEQAAEQGDGSSGISSSELASTSNDPAPSAYMKVARPGDQAVFVQDFIQKKKNFDEALRKQQVYTKMLEDLKQEQQGIDEIVRQEKRALVQQQLTEVNKKINTIKSYQASSR